MASSARRGTFAFDLSKPLKKGTLLKQGQLHKAFKYRYFVLYPGFLVYYDDMKKWKLDITRGETLGVSWLRVSCTPTSRADVHSNIALPPTVCMFYLHSPLCINFVARYPEEGGCQWFEFVSVNVVVFVACQ